MEDKENNVDQVSSPLRNISISSGNEIIAESNETIPESNVVITGLVHSHEAVSLESEVRLQAPEVPPGDYKTVSIESESTSSDDESISGVSDINNNNTYSSQLYPTNLANNNTCTTEYPWLNHEYPGPNFQWNSSDQSFANTSMTIINTDSYTNTFTDTRTGTSSDTITDLSRTMSSSSLSPLNSSTISIQSRTILPHTCAFCNTRLESLLKSIPPTNNYPNFNYPIPTINFIERKDASIQTDLLCNYEQITIKSDRLHTLPRSQIIKTYKTLDMLRPTRQVHPLMEIENIRNTGLDDFENIDCILHILRFAGIFLMISGGAIFTLIMFTCFNIMPLDFIHYYLSTNRFTLLTIIAGIIHSFIVGSVCVYTLSHLRYIRSYYLRVPFSLIIPLAVFFVSKSLLKNIPSHLKLYLERSIEYYYQSDDHLHIWDSLQKQLNCCGIHNYTDWKLYYSASNIKQYPQSCCVDTRSWMCPDFDTLIISKHILRSEGCFIKLKQFLELVAIIVCTSAALQLIFEVLTVVLMRRLYILMRHHIHDNRTICKIVCMACSSICESVSDEHHGEFTGYHIPGRPFPRNKRIGID